MMEYGNEWIENNYRDIYSKVYPHVTRAVDQMMETYGADAELSGELLDNSMGDILTKSGLDNNPRASDGAVPAMAGLGCGYGYDCADARDITRILLLRELFGRRRGRREFHDGFHRNRRRY